MEFWKVWFLVRRPNAREFTLKVGQLPGPREAAKRKARKILQGFYPSAKLRVKRVTRDRTS